MKETALYIHIPFCDHKCIYCDFYSIITNDNIAAFLQSLEKEIIFYSNRYARDRLFTSVYFGGGTPSLMEPDYLEQILLLIKKYLSILHEAEITMETNPGTVDKKKLEFFKNVGINRISIGIQSFDETDLKFLTRIHNRETAIRTVLDAKETGYDNISIDLIFNLPGQTKEKWLLNLREAIRLPIQHISAYSLILERGTILNKMVLDGKVKIQDEDHDADLYKTTIDFLTENGFYQYEVSNFTKPGYECMHNNSYWHYHEYLGLGTSSHSFIDGTRFWNYSSLKRYICEVEKNGNAISGNEKLTPEETHEEYVMLSLRSSGIDVNNYKENFGDAWLNKNYSYFLKLENEKLVLLEDDKIKFTKSGYAVCDEILKNIL